MRRRSKPDSVLTGHSSAQSTRGLKPEPFGPQRRTGSPSTPYLILLRGGFACCGPPSRATPVGSCPTPFTYRRLSRTSCLISVALSVNRVCPGSRGHYSLALRPVESGLSSALRPRSVPPPHFRVKKLLQSRYRMRPHIVHATMSVLRSTICATWGGCTRWHPPHTPSPVSGTTTGHRLVLMRS